MSLKDKFEIYRGVKSLKACNYKIACQNAGYGTDCSLCPIVFLGEKVLNEIFFFKKHGSYMYWFLLFLAQNALKLKFRRINFTIC